MAAAIGAAATQAAVIALAAVIVLAVAAIAVGKEMEMGVWAKNAVGLFGSKNTIALMRPLYKKH
jgi:hypothetical protein